MTASRFARGFTLIELMVGTVIAVISLGAIAASFAAVQAAYQSEARVKSSVEGARAALGYLEHSLARAGYGVDPRWAFDLSAPSGGAKDNQQLTPFSASPLRPQVVTDDLLYRYRNPSFSVRARLTGTTLTVDPLYNASFGVALRHKQLLQLSCQGAESYAALRVDGSFLATAASITLDTSATGVLYTSKDVAAPALSACITSDLLYVTLIHEDRIRIVTIGVNNRPYLVVFHDPTENVSTGTNYDLIAPDVETFQVAYLMNRGGFGGAPPDVAGNANWIMGDDPSDGLPVTPPSNASGSLPQYETPYIDPSRFGGASANIRAVRVTVVVRSNGPDTQRRTAFPPAAAENFTPTSIAPDGYYRTRATSMIRIPNMTARAFFNPPLKDPAEIVCPNPGCVDLNLGGG